MDTTSFSTLITEYDQKRMRAQQTALKHKDEIYEKIPAYKDLQDQVSTLCLQKTRELLAGNKSAVAQLQEKLTNIGLEKQKLLKQAGYDPSYLLPKYECPDCEDTGYLSDSKMCHCLKQKLSLMLYEQSGLKSVLKAQNFEHLSFEYYEGEDLVLYEKAYKAAKDFVADFTKTYRNLFFYGTVGTGKSFLSNCIAKELLDEGKHILYFSSAGLIDQISDLTFNPSYEKGYVFYFKEMLYNCDLLIIDDLGTECVNSFVSSELFQLLNTRNNNKKSTIISSNISIKDLRDKYSERIFSRIASEYDFYKFQGTDIRMQNKFNNPKNT